MNDKEKATALARKHNLTIKGDKTGVVLSRKGAGMYGISFVDVFSDYAETAQFIEAQENEIRKGNAPKWGGAKVKLI